MVEGLCSLFPVPVPWSRLLRFPIRRLPIEAHAHLGFIAARTGDTTTALAVDRWLADLRNPYLLGQNTELRYTPSSATATRPSACFTRPGANGRFFDVGKHVYFEYLGLRGYPPFEEWLAPKG